MSSALQTALRLLVCAAGVALSVAGILALRAEDWPIYVTFVALSLLLFPFAVEAGPKLIIPLPGLALTLGFLYIGGLPIIVLRNVAPPNLAQLLHAALPERWRTRLPEYPGWGRLLGRAATAGSTERSAVGADWASMNVGLGVRWWVAAQLAAGGDPTSHPEAILAGELAGYAAWAVLSLLPVFSFQPLLFRRPEGSLRPVFADLTLIMVLTLTPFLFLIAYGYSEHGLAGAVAWSLAALGVHFLLKRLNERRLTVEEQNRRLETLNRELEHRERLSAIGKMSSVVSHQMLQQLGLIGLHADLIRNLDADGDAAGAVTRARANAGAIQDALGGVNRVLTDLLVFSKDLRLNLYEQPLRRVVEESVDECRPEAHARAVTLRLDCPVDVPVVLDKLKMKQALVNVLRNAVEATPADGAVLVRAAARDGWVEIAVTDQGPGVPETDREAVFAPFFTTKEQGTGLGLAIAREFTEAHGGRLAIEPQAGPGATFVVRLPLRPA